MTDYLTKIGFTPVDQPAEPLQHLRPIARCVYCGETTFREGPYLRGHRMRSCPEHREDVYVPAVCDA